MNTSVPNSQQPIIDLEEGDDASRYAVSYRAIRMWVGRLGLLLPTSLFLIDWWVLRGGILFRGSLSAYYHSGARDIFVGVLAITGFMMIVYMAGQRSTPFTRFEWRLSTLTGAAALFVAAIPTKRPGAPSPACGPEADPVPLGCTRVQQLLGESVAGVLHFIATGIFIASLAGICFLVFAKRERDRAHLKRARTHRICGLAIVLGVSWIGVGGFLDIHIVGWTPLLVAEVVSVYAFGLSWVLMSYDLLPAPVAKSLEKLRLA